MRSFAPLILAALASTASAQSFDASAGQSAPTDVPFASGGPQASGIRPTGTGSAAFPQGTGGFGGQGGHGGLSGTAGFAGPSGQIGGQHSSFPSHTGSDFAFPTGSRPVESGSPRSVQNIARQAPSGGNFDSGVKPSGNDNGGAQPTRESGAVPTGSPSSDESGGSDSSAPSRVAGGVGASPSGDSNEGARAGKPSLAARQVPTSGFESVSFPMASHSGAPNHSGSDFPLPTGGNFGGAAGSGALPQRTGSQPTGQPTGLPTIPIPSGTGLPLIPTGHGTAFPSGGFPTTFETRLRPTTSA